MPQKLTRYVHNNRSRLGIKPRLIILHTTEGYNRSGTSDLTSLASWFNGPEKLSAHYGVDQQGNSVRMVPDDRVAYAAGTVYNSISLNIEQVAFADRTSKQQWIRDHHLQLYRVAAILADWHEKYNIPLKFSRFRGVCEHKHISGVWGHHDCGKGYPLEYVITWAQLINMRRNQPRRRATIKQLERRVAHQQRIAGRKHVDTRPW